MKTFRVEVSVSITDSFVVHGEDKQQAEKAAAACLNAHLGYDRGGEMHFAAMVLEQVADARPSTYVCSGCKASLPKQAFGPGWLKCPLCGEPPVPVS